MNRLAQVLSPLVRRRKVKLRRTSTLQSPFAPKLTRILRLSLVSLALATAALGQQYPFVKIGGPDAPRGCFFPFQDSRGGLWLAGCETGTEGFFYFDGTRFTSPLKSPFPQGVVRGMAEDSEGGIWIASSSGIYRAYKGNLERLVVGAAWSGITRIAPDVFLATAAKFGHDVLRDADVLRIARTDGKWKADAILTSVPQAQFRLGRSGSILYGREGGFCELQSRDVAQWRPGTALAVTHHVMPTPTTYLQNSPVVWRDRFGCVWMRSQFDASYQCSPNSPPVTLPANIVSQGYPLIFELNDGSIVIPSFGRLAIGRPGRFRVVTALNGYPSAGGALVTKNGRVLLTNQNGLFLFSPQLRLEFWSAQDGLEGNTWSVLRLGNKMFAIAGDSIRVLDRDRRSWQLLARLRAGTHLIAGPNNTILAGSHTGGVVQLSQDGRILRRSVPTDVSMLARTPDGQIWAAGNSTFRVVPTGKRLKLEPADTASPQPVGLDMKIDHDGSLWTCSAAGLGHLDGSVWRILSTRAGLLEDQCISFAIDGAGDIWYAYLDTPFLSLIQNPRSTNPLFRHFPGGGELPTARSYFLNVDCHGWLWRGAPDGIYVATLEEAREGQWLRLGREDGLPEVNANQKSFFQDTDGSVWFGVENSIVHLLPSGDLVHPDYAPSVFVSAFSWNGGPPKMADAVDGIPHGSNIIAYIGSLPFDRHNNLRLRYRLVPEQSSWRETRSLDLALGKLGWGSHTLQVQARLFTGPWSGTVTQSFTVLRPGWLAWPLVLAYLLTVMLLSAGAYVLRWRHQAEDVALFPNLATWRLGALLPEVHELAGTVLDSRFEVGEILARGGFAHVMSGYDRGQQQRCAIKVFRREMRDKAWVQRRFEQEVTALQQIRHTNVVPIYAKGIAPSGSPYLVMEFIEGRNLRAVLEAGALPPARVARLLRQLAGALDAIHSKNIWHRDVKPENIMIRNEGAPNEEPVLIDFSIAIVKDADETLHGLSRAAGTFDYMAPEQAIGYAQNSSDIYSLSKVLIEMLTGRRLSDLLPDAALDLPQQVRKLLRSLDLGLGEDSVTMLAMALEFDPAKRPQAGSSFARPLVEDLELGTQVRQR
jgi:tRNA A-37 threonylcarbamoyl transferase component Bud32